MVIFDAFCGLSAAPDVVFRIDVGIANSLLGRKTIVRGTPDFGQALEHLVFLELKTFLSYHRLDHSLAYWRTQSQLEVDFVVGHDIAIEVKGAGRVGPSDTKALKALSEEIPLKRKIVVCMERNMRQQDDGIEIIPAHDFLRRLWGGDIVA